MKKLILSVCICIAVSFLTSCMSVTVVRYKEDTTPQMPGVAASVKTGAAVQTFPAI